MPGMDVLALVGGCPLEPAQIVALVPQRDIPINRVLEGLNPAVVRVPWATRRHWRYAAGPAPFTHR